LNLTIKSLNPGWPLKALKDQLPASGQLKLGAASLFMEFQSIRPEEVKHCIKL